MKNQSLYSYVCYNTLRYELPVIGRVHARNLEHAKEKFEAIYGPIPVGYELTDFESHKSENQLCRNLAKGKW